MALTLKDQFQIKAVPAFQAADGTRFHDLPEAQDFTRRKMVEAAIDFAVKGNAQFARLEKSILMEFCLASGRHLGAIMAETLEPVDPEAAAKVPMPRAVAPYSGDNGDYPARKAPPSMTEILRGISADEEDFPLDVADIERELARAGSV